MAMLYRYLAAILLLPASLSVFPSWRKWTAALNNGAPFFFSQVVKQAPDLIRCRGWTSVFVYWPMKIGITLIRSGSLRLTAQKCLRIFRWSGRRDTSEQRAISTRPVPIAHVHNLLRNNSIKVVSFDIFDTLLTRPVLHPKDIFHLVAARVKKRLNLDFIAMRWKAEERLGFHANIHEIYEDIQQRFRLDRQTAQTLMDEEIRCETILLGPRPEIKKLYDEAVSQGKRIIAVSDMYLPGNILKGILRKNGYEPDAIYVSCDYRQRKSTGSLYNIVISKESVQPSEILHIGDDYTSDFEAAVRARIVAVHYPSALGGLFFGENRIQRILDRSASSSPYWSLLLGYSLNSFFRREDENAHPLSDVRDLRHFAALTIAPLLTGYSLSLMRDKRIQDTYKQINFASRDGYLPREVYEITRHYLRGIPGVYCHAGRRAYYPFLYQSFQEYAESRRHCGDANYTLHDFLKAHFAGSTLLADLERNLTDEEKALPFFEQQEKALVVLGRMKKNIENFLDHKRARIQKYYGSVLSAAEQHHIVFDLGYSGSIGRALTAICGKPVDKLFFWEDPENRIADRECGSTTRLFGSDDKDAATSILLEELFSPCEGGVVDFDADGTPVLEDIAASDAMKADLDAVHQTCCEFAAGFCERFDDYAKYIAPENGEGIFAVIRYLLGEAPFCNLRIFKNIQFPDPIYYKQCPSLEKKVEHLLPHATPFSGTGFESPHNRIAYRPPLSVPPRVGVHLHLHNMTLASEIVRYLQDFPTFFDLYITITDAASAQTARHLFGRSFIPNADAVMILPVQNRGRDVAPWVLGMRPFQDKYELFCHIHAKESRYVSFGNGWRTYLFDNLIHCDAVRDILDLFQAYPQLGCLFPPPYEKLRSFMVSRDISPAGLKGEMNLASALLRRMGLHTEICRSEIFFPMGNMLWYRPQALRQLFTCNLSLEEFAPEPLGVEGSLAHAIERLPAVMATKNGYRTGTFVRAF